MDWTPDSPRLPLPTRLPPLTFRPRQYGAWAFPEEMPFLVRSGEAGASEAWSSALDLHLQDPLEYGLHDIRGYSVLFS